MRNFLFLMLSFMTFHSQAGDVSAAINKSMSVIDDRIIVEDIRPSPVSGVVEVAISGGEFAYATEDAEYIFWGRLIKVQDDHYIDMTESRIEEMRKGLLADLDHGEAISFFADGIEKYSIYVFTDISCGYCRKFHEEVGEINKAGVTVHYLGFPRAGPESEVRHAMDNLWCAEDPGAALTKAKASGEIPEKAVLCRSPVVSQFILGHRLKVSGTPAIYTPDGRQIGGYLTAKEVIDALVR